VKNSRLLCPLCPCRPCSARSQDGLNSCASPADVRRSARLLQAYEKDFWDAVALNPL